MKVAFLFWNLKRSQRSALLRAITRFAENGVQVFLFAEPPTERAVLLAALNQSGVDHYEVPSQSQRILIFSSLSNVTWTDRFFNSISDRITVQELQPENELGILIVGAHLDSANYLTPADRADWAREVAEDIRRIEGDAGHQRTLLAGDLNMNPYDEGLVGTTALHAVMTRQLAMSVQGLESRKGYSPFYNPMWSCYGDRPSGPNSHLLARPAGTYYFSNTKARASHFWQMYDQVLLRPDLMNRLVHLEILDTDGEQALVTKEGRPRSDALTDHLPILFQLEL